MRIVYGLLLTLFIFGCSHKSVDRINTKDMQLTTIRWGANDLQEMAVEMASSVLSSQIDFSKNRVYAFGKIRNDTYDHIDTKLLANKTMTALSKSGKLVFSENLQSKVSKFDKGEVH